MHHTPTPFAPRPRGVQMALPTPAAMFLRPTSDCLARHRRGISSTQSEALEHALIPLTFLHGSPPPDSMRRAESERHLVSGPSDRPGTRVIAGSVEWGSSFVD